VERPFAAIGAELGLEEGAVIARIQALMARGAIKRLGVMVRHQELGYGANAMVVWDLPDAGVDALGRRIGQRPYVTLCYRRPRCLPAWPYNLFTMIHGRDRAAVLAQVEAIKGDFDLGSVPSEVLFSGQRFKQRGAYYQPAALADARPATDPLGATAMSSTRLRASQGA
jgi:DNA-binding Lrp family transcriptional regulator